MLYCRHFVICPCRYTTVPLYSKIDIRLRLHLRNTRATRRKSEIHTNHTDVPGYQVQHRPLSSAPSTVMFVAEGLDSLTPGDFSKIGSGQTMNASRVPAVVLTLSSSNTPLRILSRMSLVACSNAASTFSPLFALASTNRRPSSFAQSSASSVLTSRGFFADPCASSAHKTILFPTRIQVRCGSACSRTSASQERALTNAGNEKQSAECKVQP